MLSWLRPGFLWIILFILLKVELSECLKPLNIRDILPEDQSEYNKEEAPKVNGQPVNVTMYVQVLGLDSIDENSMTYTADIFFGQEWNDHRLQFPKNMSSYKRVLDVDDLRHIWRPKSYFRNAKSVTFQTVTSPNHYLYLYNDTTILYMIRLTLTLSCPMNFRIYPHDTQECVIQVESLADEMEDVVFHWGGIDIENFELPQLHVVQNKTSDCTHFYMGGENFHCVQVVFVLQRRIGYYLFYTYIPTCLIVCMSWISFWIKPELAPARVTLGVTSVLTLSTQHAKSQASLPPVSYLKAIDAFMSACTLFVFMALMEFCVVVIVLGDSDLPKTPESPTKEKKVVKFADKDSAHVLSGHPLAPPTGKEKQFSAEQARTRAINIDRFSRVFFPVLFAILNCTYWIVFVGIL